MVRLGPGPDLLIVEAPLAQIVAGRGRDRVVIEAEADVGAVHLGRGDDRLEVSGMVDLVSGGRGHDTLAIDRALADFDVSVRGGSVTLIDRLTGEEMAVRGVESFEFDGAVHSVGALARTYGPGAAVPALVVDADSLSFVVNDPSPTLSVIWDRVVQQAVMDTAEAMGPTYASRAYAMMHTAIYDAWASFDARAERVSRDVEGDNAALAAAAPGADKAEAMSWAAFTVLKAMFPDMEALFTGVMQDRFGLDPEGAGGVAAEIGRDAAEDQLAFRAIDGSGAAGDYAPVNAGPLDVVDIARWTPESVPPDPEGVGAVQVFLTPQWGGVESFSLSQTDAGGADLAPFDLDGPEAFFAAGQEGATLDLAAGTVTLGAAAVVDGIAYAAGAVVGVTKALIGPVINAGFVAQAEEVVSISAGLTEREKLVAEFWEHGGGSPFPPGAFMSIGQFVSARDGHSIDDDAKLFLALGSAMFDAGVAAWQAKVDHDYARPVRVIRELGELGLIGEWGVDELTGEAGFVIEAFGGFDPLTGASLGTRTILAENFVTYQTPGGASSPPFSEYVSGHSTFSAAGAEVLRLFTGSDAFGGSATFDAGISRFDPTLPGEAITLAWDTFSDAADEAGMSRLYGGIHFSDGDLHGRELGRDVGVLAFDLAERFWTGAAQEADRPFSGWDLLV